MEDISINELKNKLLELAKQKGFGHDINTINVAEKFALIHSEVSEAYEAYRKKNFDDTKDGFNQELSDIILRTLHLAGCLNIDIVSAINKKMEINDRRVWDKSKLNEKLN